MSVDYYVLGHLNGLAVTFFGMTSGKAVSVRPLVETPWEHRNHEVSIEDIDPIPPPEALKPIGNQNRNTSPWPTVYGSNQNFRSPRIFKEHTALWSIGTDGKQMGQRGFEPRTSRLSAERST